MKVEYRIQNIDGNYFPHVRTKKLLFWSKWKKIAEHPGNSYGMYSLPDTNYPKTKDECQEIIDNFDLWFKSALSPYGRRNIETFTQYQPTS